MAEEVLDKVNWIFEKFFPLEGEHYFFGLSTYDEKPYRICANGNLRVILMIVYFELNSDTGERNKPETLVQECVCLTANQLQYSQERLDAFFESYSELVRYIIEWEAKHQRWLVSEWEGRHQHRLGLIPHSLMNLEVMNALDLKRVNTKENFERALTSKKRLGKYLIEIQRFEHL